MKSKTFGERIRELRQLQNLSQRDLADKVAAGLKGGFDFTYLSKIENDRMPPPSMPAILQLAEVLEVNSDELLALAGKAPADLGDALKQSEAARTFYRSAINMNLSEEDWKKLIADLQRKKKG